MSIFEDDYAITVADQEADPGELRFASIGAGVKGQVLVVIYTYRGRNIRIISARLADPRERKQYEGIR